RAAGPGPQGRGEGGPPAGGPGPGPDRRRHPAAADDRASPAGPARADRCPAARVPAGKARPMSRTRRLGAVLTLLAAAAAAPAQDRHHSHVPAERPTDTDHSPLLQARTGPLRPEA